MLQKSFAKTRDALVITSALGKIIDWNPAAEQLLGYTKAEAVGVSFAELELTSDGPQLLKLLSVAQKEAYAEAEITLYRRSGEEVFSLTNVFPTTGYRRKAFLWLIRDYTGRRKTKQALQEANDRFEAFAQNSRKAFWIGSTDGQEIFYMGPAIESIVGSRVEGFPKRVSERWLTLIHPDDREHVAENRRKYISGQAALYKYRIILPSGRIRWIQSHAFPVRNAQGEIYRLAGLLEDITEQEEIVERLNRAIEQKAALLQEVHHRVKNNLQIISSLMRLQERCACGTDANAVLRESRQRVDTIALLHEQLHRSENLSRINFQAYADNLAAYVTRLHQLQETIKITVDVKPILLDPDTALLCGLILSELVTNSLRHAFPDSGKGEIIIRSQTKDETIVLIVGDNGVGVPPQFDPGTGTTLGYRLIQQLTRQLKGTIAVSSQEGLNVQIEFPLHGPSSQATG